MDTQPATNMRMIWASAVALLYGLGAHAAFQTNWGNVLIGTLSISFLLLTPLAIGAITVALSPARVRTSLVYAIFAPWAPCFLLAGIAILLQRELALCVGMALPIFLPLSSVGGLLAAVAWRRRSAPVRSNGAVMGLLIMLPFLFAPLERQIAPTAQERTVERSVTIEADAQTVWQHFVVVPTIQDSEQRIAWFRLLGLPQPVEAVLSRTGPHGMRHARYSSGMAVIEPIVEWQPHRRYAFEVHLDPNAPLPSPLWRAADDNDHLDIQRVEYEVEPQSDGAVVLHLRTTYRLATPFNPYSGRWIDFLLADFEAYILRIVKARAEL